MGFHVFVVMPYGVKEGIDFDAVYSQLVEPALAPPEFRVVRADMKTRADETRNNMLHELFLADVVVADLTIDNPNIWYELGVRHALHARGVILISARRAPIDLFAGSKLKYRLRGGVPDPEFLRTDKVTLAQLAHEIGSAWHGRAESPVWRLLEFSQNSDRTSLHVGGAREFWSSQEDWGRRVAIARRKQKPGDILVLAEETPIRSLRLEGYRSAANALRKLKQFDFALAQIDRALEVDPEDLISRKEKGILLGRLHRFDEAREWLKAMADDYPQDAETFGLLGGVEKENWICSWRTENATPEEKLMAAAADIGLLREAIGAYTAGFLRDPFNYYCGINAVMLRHLDRYLIGTEDDAEAASRANMEQVVRRAARAALSRETSKVKNFWARVTLADLAALLGDTNDIERAYEYAVAAADKNRFALNSTRQECSLLGDLGFRRLELETAIRVIDCAISPLKSPFRPGKVFLFSGHMIDAPGRETERFPADMEDLSKASICQTLDELGAENGDLALCEGACGGDLLFAQAVLDRQLRLELRLPFDEPTFVQRSVAFAGEEWRQRYFNIKNNAATRTFIMPDELGPTPENRNPYERANLWQLYSAFAWGADRVRMIALWDCQKSGEYGGTEHMVEEVLRRSGQIRIISSRELLMRVQARRN